MKITAVKLLRLRGTMAFEGRFWEERLVRPVDLYPEHASQGEQPIPQVEPGKYRMESIFLRIETDSDGMVGIGGPVPHGVAYQIARAIAPHLVGHDPLAVERIWDRIYRQQIHGRKGDAMLALSAVDCALWDLRGKWANAPVYRLLGGPVRESLPAYASGSTASTRSSAIALRSGSSATAPGPDRRGSGGTSRSPARCARRSATTTT